MAQQCVPSLSFPLACRVRLPLSLTRSLAQWPPTRATQTAWAASSGTTNPFLLRKFGGTQKPGVGRRFAPWWLNSNGALTSHRLTPRPVPRATYDVLHPDAKPLFRHVTEGMEDEMARSQTRHF